MLLIIFLSANSNAYSFNVNSNVKKNTLLKRKVNLAIKNLKKIIKNNKNNKINKTITLKDLIKFALENPKIKSELNKIKGYKQNIKIDKSLPDPVFGFTYNNANGFNNPEIGTILGSNYTYSFNQKIPFPTKLFLKSGIAKMRYKSLNDNFIGFSLLTVLNVKYLYYDLALTNSDIAIIKYDYSLLKMIKKIVEESYVVKKTNATGPVRLMLEMIDMKSDLIALKARRRKILLFISLITDKKFNYIKNNLHPIFPGHISYLKLDYKKLLSKAYHYNPYIKSAEYLYKQSKLTFNLAKQGFYPNFFVSLSYGYRYFYPPALAAGIGLSLPLYFSQKQMPDIKKSKKYMLSSIYKKNWVYLKINSDIKNSLNYLNKYYKLYTANKKLYLPESIFLLNLYTNSFEVHHSSSFAMVDAFKKVVKSELNVYKYKADYLKKAAFLKTVIGKFSLNYQKIAYKNGNIYKK
ncbi:MAG: TolC family protein [bacterium]